MLGPLAWHWRIVALLVPVAVRTACMQAAAVAWEHFVCVFVPDSMYSVKQLYVSNVC